MRDYDLSSLKKREKEHEDDRQYESFNISKELERIRNKIQDKKNKKRFGY